MHLLPFDVKGSTAKLDLDKFQCIVCIAIASSMETTATSVFELL